MIDPVQIVLLIVISVLTVLLLILGFQVFFILKELRNTLRHATNILENTESITESVSEPLSIVSGFLLNAKALSTIAKILRKTRDGEE